MAGDEDSQDKEQVVVRARERRLLRIEFQGIAARFDEGTDVGRVAANGRMPEEKKNPGLRRGSFFFGSL